MSHKTKPPFSHWGIIDCARDGSKGALDFLGGVVFDRTCYPGYGAKKVHTGAGSFPVWDALTFIWSKSKSTPANGTLSQKGPDQPASQMPEQLPRTIRRSCSSDETQSITVEKRMASGKPKSTPANKPRKDGAQRQRVIQVHGRGFAVVDLTEQVLDEVCDALLIPE